MKLVYHRILREKWAAQLRAQKWRSPGGVRLTRGLQRIFVHPHAFLEKYLQESEETSVLHAMRHVRTIKNLVTHFRRRPFTGLFDTDNKATWL